MASLQEKRQKILQFKGGLAATVTPYDSNGEVDVSVIPGYIEFLVENKVNGAYISGTTGEGYNLTNEEKLAIALQYQSEVKRQNIDFFTVVNVTSTCIKEALQLAKQVEAIGVDAIAVLPPNYYKPTSVDDLVNYLKLFGNAAPNTPLLYYHIPFIVGELPFDIVDVVREALRQVPQFAAMKYTDTNMTRLSILQKNFKNNFKIFNGFDECLLSSFAAVDCEAAVCALFNIPVVIQLFHKIRSAVENGDLVAAREAQYKIIDECLHYKSQGNFIRTLKSAFNVLMKERNLNFGYPRPPISYEYNFQ